MMIGQFVEPITDWPLVTQVYKSSPVEGKCEHLKNYKTIFTAKVVSE